jgi:phosphopantetheine adenylyltransferase
LKLKKRSQKQKNKVKVPILDAMAKYIFFAGTIRWFIIQLFTGSLQNLRVFQVTLALLVNTGYFVYFFMTVFKKREISIEG